MNMNRIVTVAALGLSLGACAGAPSWMSFELPRSGPPQTTLQFESEPAGAEARTSTGQACQTPCSLTVPATEFTVTFARQGFQSQTVPVRVAPSESADPEFDAPAPRLVPSPVYAELQPAAPVPAARRRAAPAPKRTSSSQPAPSAAAAPRPASVRPSAPPSPPPAPAPAPASPWPPVPGQR